MGSNVFLGQYHYEPNGMIAAVTWWQRHVHVPAEQSQEPKWISTNVPRLSVTPPELGLLGTRWSFWESEATKTAIASSKDRRFSDSQWVCRQSSFKLQASASRPNGSHHRRSCGLVVVRKDGDGISKLLSVSERKLALQIPRASKLPKVYVTA